jgi:hypothetical protein
MFAAVLLLVFTVPPCLTGALRGTSLFWLPGAGVAVLAVIVFAQIEGGPHPDAAGVVTAMGNGICVLIGLFLLVYATILFLVGAKLSRHVEQTPPEGLPMARQVNRVDAADAASTVDRTIQGP